MSEQSKVNAAPNNVQGSYDRVAAEYASRIAGELAHKPHDRQLLDLLARRAEKLGPICDVGCGPGHVAGYLRRQGAVVCGIDLSAGMVEQARRLHPDIEFAQGDMLALNVPDNAWGGIAAFYSLIHVPHDQIPMALLEMKRALKPDGWLLVAFHIGIETVHLEEWWGEQVILDFRFFQPAEVTGWLAEAGFLVHEVIEREPYPDVEHPSRRAYIFAQKPV
jgi:ubiquinone/menaquinone biosynthesis C-methylase UbiE